MSKYVEAREQTWGKPQEGCLPRLRQGLSLALSSPVRSPILLSPHPQHWGYKMSYQAWYFYVGLKG